MVVKSRAQNIDAGGRPLDLGYVALFLGLRVNHIVMERMRSAGFENVRESHGYVIQHLIEKERSITEFARRMEVTQQAASKMIAEMEQLGAVDTVPGSDRRAKKVRLSLRGWEVVRLGRQIRRQIERRLIRAAGARQYETAQSVLTVCLEALGGLESVRARRVLPPQ
jgi:DNA-binding MarR family transcriptional regulator